MRIWSIDDACEELGIARRTLQYHLRRIGCQMVGGRYLINDEIIDKLRDRNSPGRPFSNEKKV